jgi:hypothetical protein
MNRGEIVAYRAIVSADLRGWTLPHGDFAMISTQEGRNHDNESRGQGVVPLAYLRPTTVQTMGGS